MHHLPRRLTVLSVALLLASTVNLFAPTLAASSGAAPAVTPAQPHVGDVFVISGSVPGRFARTVRLQRWSPSGYTVRTSMVSDAAGRYRFTYRSASPSLRLRVVAPALTRRGHRWAGVVSRPTLVKQRPQTISWSAPATAYAGEPVDLTIRLTPRAARPVVLQRRTGTTWTTEQTRRTSAAGTVTFVAVPRAPGTAAYRAVATVNAGRPAITAATRTLQISRNPDSAPVAAPASPHRGESFALSGTVPGGFVRSAQLQVDTGSGFKAVARGVTDAQGGYGFTTSHAAASPVYRVAAPAVTHAGVHWPTFVSATRQVEQSSNRVATLEVTTDAGAEITSGEDYRRATLRLEPRDSGLPEFTTTTRIRLRGNSTSWITIKPSYKLKLDAKTALAGMPASKDWALLANFYDRSMLRNAAAFEAARRIGMPWVPRTVWTEVTVNGKYLGLYQLSETVTAAKTRVALPDDGVLLEADSWADDDPHFTTSEGLQVFLKDPDDGDQALTDATAQKMQRVEDALYSPDFADPELGYRGLVDADSFVDWYLLNELMKTVDSAFNNSIWMSLANGRLAMAAPWDFDQAAGNRAEFGGASPSGLFLGHNWAADSDFVPSQITDPRGHWLIRMLQDPWFREKVSARWRQVSPALQDLSAYVDEQATLVADSAARNFAPTSEGGAGQPVGPTFLEPPATHLNQGSWSAETTHLESWLTDRVSWLDGYFAEDDAPR